RSLGLFQGAKTEIQPYVDAILAPGQAIFIERQIAEHDESYKQLIPYVVLRCQGLIFTYARGHSSREARLHGRLSIGLGGHIVESDATSQITRDMYCRAASREVSEEVEIGAPYSERIVALINDDSDEVGRVHFGVVHLWDLTAP